MTSKNTLHPANEPRKPVEEDLDELEAQAHERAAESHALFAKVARLRCKSALTSSAPQLLTRRMYVARFGTPDGWSALESAAERGDVAEHRLGRSKAFLEADVMRIAATREPRKAARGKPLDDANPRAAYLAIVGGGSR